MVSFQGVRRLSSQAEGRDRRCNTTSGGMKAGGSGSTAVCRVGCFAVHDPGGGVMFGGMKAGICDSPEAGPASIAISTARSATGTGLGSGPTPASATAGASAGLSNWRSLTSTSFMIGDAAAGIVGSKGLVAKVLRSEPSESTARSMWPFTSKLRI
jgi:hypothetical protein